MTRKDYKLIAKVFNTRREIEKLDSANTDLQAVVMFVLDSLALSLAVDLEQENERFDKTKFLDACGFQK